MSQNVFDRPEPQPRPHCHYCWNDATRREPDTAIGPGILVCTEHASPQARDLLRRLVFDRDRRQP